MRLKVVVHEAEEGGFWAEVPAIPGRATEGETFEELLTNLYEAVEGCLSVDVALKYRVPSRRCTITSHEIVHLVRFKTLEQGHDPGDVFRDIDVSLVQRRHCQSPPRADDESIDTPHPDSACAPPPPPRTALLAPGRLRCLSRGVLARRRRSSAGLCLLYTSPSPR